MTDKQDWVDIGSAQELARTPLKSCIVRTIAIAISFNDEQFGAVSNFCNHVIVPLGEGRLMAITSLVPGIVGNSLTFTPFQVRTTSNAAAAGPQSAPASTEITHCVRHDQKTSSVTFECSRV